MTRNPDGSFDISNNDAFTYHFEKILGNPLRVEGRAPWMLKRITDRNDNFVDLFYHTTGPHTGLLSHVEASLDGRTGKRRVSFEYNGANRLWKIKDPIERVTTLGYDGSGNLATIDDPMGNQVRYGYNSRHQVTQKSDKNGRQWQYQYDAAGHPIGIVDAAGNPLFNLSNDQEWRTDYNALFRNKERVYIPGTTTRTDGNGKEWQYDYDRDGLVTRVKTPDDPINQDPDGATTEYRYDPQTLNLDRVEDDNNHVTEYFYDLHANLTKERNDKGQETLYSYYPAGGFTRPLYDRVETITYPNGSVTEYTYDTDGNRLTETLDAGGLNLVITWTYFPDGNVETETDPNGHTTSYEYDAYGNLTKTIDALGCETEYRYHKIGVPDYEALGNRTRLIDGNDHETAYAYDALDRLIKETDPEGFVTNTFYDPVGNREAVQRQVAKAPADWQLTTYLYDERDRLTRETQDPVGDPRNPHADPLDLTTRYSYDRNDNRIETIDPRGFATGFDYDAQNRLIRVTDALTNVTETRYDGVGNRTCQIDANIHYTFYEYDSLDRLEKTSRKMDAQECTTGVGNDLITQHFYDTGETTSCRPGGGAPNCAGPMPGGSNIAHAIDPEGRYTHFKYDKLERRWVTIRKVNPANDATGLCDGDDWCEYTEYDGADNLVSRIDANGNVTGFTYYANDWLETETVDPGGLDLTTRYTYDCAGNVDTVTSPRGNVTDNDYNARNELTDVNDSVGHVADYAYDGIGNRVQECDGNGNCTGYSYDAANRLIDIVDPMAATTLNDYDENGNLIKVTDREGHVTCHIYDPINRRTYTVQKIGDTDCSVIDADDIWTRTDYDPAGNVDALATAREATPAACESGSPPVDCEITGYDYDEADRLKEETYADATTRQFFYDKAGNLTDRVDQLGQVTLYGYNDLYYLMQRDYQDAGEPDDSFQYDVGGRMTRAERDGWVVTFDAYDAANRLLQTTQDGTGVPMVVQYVYDTPTGLRTLHYPGGRIITESTDLRERLQRVDRGPGPAFPITPLAFYQYDPGNRVSFRRYENGCVATYTYNANDRLLDVEHDCGGTVIADFNYDYDKEGNKRFEKKIHDPGKSEEYGYDEVYRLIDYKVGNLVGSTVPLPVTQTQYDLDKVGNWDQFTVDADGAGPGVPIDYNNTPNVMNEYDEDGPEDGIPDDFKDDKATPAADGEDWGHDDNGNRTYDAKQVYEYDDENRLVRIQRKIDNVITTYQYDALGRRVVKAVDVLGTPVVTRFAYDNARAIEEQDALGNALATYVYGNYIDEVLNMQRGGDEYYYHQNALWSVIAVTDRLANVVERYAYSDYGCVSVTDGAGVPVPLNPWGTAHSAIGNPYMFTGRRWDEESGVYYYRARYYDCEGGRFLQRDQVGYLWGLNLYQYVLSMPTRFIDASGLVITARDPQEKAIWDRLAWYACLQITWGAADPKSGLRTVTALTRLQLPGGTMPDAPVRGAGPTKHDRCLECSITLRERIKKIQGVTRNISIGIVGTYAHIRTMQGEVNVARFKDLIGKISAMGAGDARNSFVEQFAHEAAREQEAADLRIRGHEAPQHIQGGPNFEKYEWIAEDQLRVMWQLGVIGSAQNRRHQALWKARDTEARNELIARGVARPTNEQIDREVGRLIHNLRPKGVQGPMTQRP